MFSLILILELILNVCPQPHWGPVMGTVHKYFEELSWGGHVMIMGWPCGDHGVAMW